ncbi:hypothetical protein AB6F62_11225 [Providencia huaxiensis]|uniref:hypothetical protein n=1 Tax=Providencia huaxiensis TaxID=2027290 RepID=UPI0034DD79ED
MYWKLFSHSSTNQQKMVRLFLINRLLDENEEFGDGRQFSKKRGLPTMTVSYGTVQFLQQYMSESWQPNTTDFNTRFRLILKTKSRAPVVAVVTTPMKYASMSMLAA